MSRKVRSLQRNMLIVCEGSVTEPEYFAVLRKIALETEIWAAIEIRPKPRSDAEENEVVPSSHKSPRQKRPLKMVPLPEEADVIEQQYPWRQIPVNFVKVARDGLKEDIFEETWAVFDRNGHPAHPQAFRLAQEPVNGKVVNIAFSSIAFEHWMLLHFERNDTAFAKSECKNQAGQYLECGTGLHVGDCWGARCVSGYMRVNQYINSSTKIHDDAFKELLQRLIAPELRKKAYENAAWLQYVVTDKQIEPYEANPYTNMDALVKRLLGEDGQTIEWAKLEQVRNWQSLLIQVDVVDDSLQLVITNIGSVTRLFNGNDIAVFFNTLEQKTELLPIGNINGVIEVNKTEIFLFKPIDRFYNTIFEIKIGTHRLLIAV